MINDNFTQKLKEKYQCKCYLPVDSKKLKLLENQVGRIPQDLKQLYSLTNGLDCENFSILPVFDEVNQKKTWDSISRANSKEETKFSLDKELLSKFLIFGEIGGRHALMFSREDESIWFEDDADYHQTDLNLENLILGLLVENQSD